MFRLGRIDRLLYPYYKADRDAGIIDDAFAQLLIDCLGIMINHRVLSGLSSGYMVGGRNADGTVVANELTYMGIRAIDDIRLSASIKKEAERYRGIRERRMQTGMMPLLSCFVNDCLERGLDIEKGGVR
ncbi:MAG: hypothetical protein IJ428_01410 [Clostridia bacterium]|nr:hypothetical protein [Clostridia bacterium]